MSFSLTFHGDLASLLRRQWRGRQQLSQAFTRVASIKDVVESFGLPHTEVGRLEVAGVEVDFSFQVKDGQRIAVWPVSVPWDVLRPSLLRPQPLTNITFVVDVNVGKLARLLRMVGLDVAYDHRWDDRTLASLAEQENRILFSKDRGLLMRNQVVFGRFIRASQPEKQLQEVISLLGLGSKLAPFTRCMECNGKLQAVAKEEIVHLLQPLTKKYYSAFSICSNCRKIYWPGSHLEKMEMNFFGPGKSL